MRAWMLVLLLAGCDELLAPTGGGPGLGTGDPDDTGTIDSCPEGWTTPLVAEVNVRNLNFSGKVEAAEVSTETYLNQAPVCISPEGDKVEVLLVVAGEPFAWLESYAEGPVNQGLADASGVRLDAFGAEVPVVFESSDWFQGTWVVTGNDGQWIHTINGDARADNETVNLWVEIEIRL